jgi:hypothetical protein
MTFLELYWHGAGQTQFNSLRCKIRKNTNYVPLANIWEINATNVAKLLLPKQNVVGEFRQLQQNISQQFSHPTDDCSARCMLQNVPSCSDIVSVDCVWWADVLQLSVRPTIAASSVSDGDWAISIIGRTNCTTWWGDTISTMNFRLLLWWHLYI